MDTTSETAWDCVIVGGGAAGLSAALVLGRARRPTLLVDAGEPSNRSAHGVGGLLGHDGRPPAELYAAGRAELAAYPAVELRDGAVVAGAPDGDGFALALADGERLRTRRVLLATGMDYGVPELPGLAELWGRSAFHCPFCHGWEVRDEPLAVLADGKPAVHATLLLRNWSDDVVLLTNGPTELEPADRRLVEAAGVAVDERPVSELVARDGALEAVAFADGGRLPRRGVLVRALQRQRSSLAEQLGAAAGPETMVAADALAVENACFTSQPGVFAAGDVSGAQAQVAAAVATGAQAGAMVVGSLVHAAHGLPFGPPPGRG